MDADGPPAATGVPPPRPSRSSRRRLLTAGLGAVGAVTVLGVAGIELVLHDVVPGHAALDRLDGGCDVTDPVLTFSEAGPEVSGRFYSQARHRTVGYSIAWPPGHRAGDPLPLVVALHAYGDDHATALSRLSLRQALALHVGGAHLPPMGMVSVDGGNGYWHAHPGDDPMAMIVDELLPRCRRLGLGAQGRPVGALGISMGGYGALLLAEQHPTLCRAVAAISPAIWTTWGQAHDADPGAFTSAGDFATNDAVTHTAALADIPVRIASGDDDPFHPGVAALARRLPAGAEVDFSGGCHDDDFFFSQQPPSLAFLGRHLGA